MIVNEVGFVKAWQVSPPVQDQLEKVYPEGILQASSAVDPKVVVEKDAPLLKPEPEHVPMLTVAEIVGLIVTFTWAA